MRAKNPTDKEVPPEERIEEIAGHRVREHLFEHRERSYLYYKCVDCEKRAFRREELADQECEEAV
jgi:hypothetical protein